MFHQDQFRFELPNLNAFNNRKEQVDIDTVNDIKGVEEEQVSIQDKKKCKKKKKKKGKKGY